MIVRGIAAALVFSVLSAFAGGGWYLVPEPRFMGREIVWPVEGSAKTALLPVRDGEPLSLAQTRDPGLTEADISAEAARSAEALFAGLRPEFVRDKRGVILFAVISSEDPLAASCVLAPGFSDKFLDTIGPDVQVAIPNRNRIYIFPRSAVPVADLADRIFVDYRASDLPVSREIFEPKDGVLRAVGEFR